MTHPSTRQALRALLAATVILTGCAEKTDAPRRSAAAPGPPIQNTVATANVPAADVPIPTYETIEQLKAIPPCKAIVVERRDVFSKLLRTPDGKRFIVGGGKGEQEVWHFLATLPDGKACDLPADFLAFENRTFYPSADEISAMPPCKATVVIAAPCYSVLRKSGGESGGEMFVIGDPGSKSVVWRFLATLESGQTYDLPGAFIDYRKSHARDKDDQE